MAQQDVTEVLVKLGEVVQGLNHGLNQQNMMGCIIKYSGKKEEFSRWMEEIEKYAYLNSVPEHNRKAIALQTSEGDVARYLTRRLQELPQEEWVDLKKELAQRFAIVTDEKYARALLKRVKQEDGESVQRLSDRILSIASEAYQGHDLGNSVINDYLLDVFVDAVRSDGLRLNLLRHAPKTFQEAVGRAVTEDNVSKRFTLTQGREPTNRPDYPTVEPMEVEHIRKAGPVGGRDSGWIGESKFRGDRQSNATSQNGEGRDRRPIWRGRDTRGVVCYNCQESGHMARSCRNEGKDYRGRGQNSSTRKF